MHTAEAAHLKNLVSMGDCPHLLFYGPAGSGKKTLVTALLTEVYGPKAEKVKVENKPWKIEAGSRKIEIELTTVASNYHVELNPSDAGFQDRYVVQEIIKEMAKNKPLDVSGNKTFKMLILNEVDRLSKEAQHSLRRTMEKYSSACRLVLICKSASKVIEAVRSRCLNVRVNAPSHENIIKVLMHVAQKENLDFPPALAGRIAKQSNRNIRHAVLSFEACKVHQYPFTDDQIVQTTDWEQYVIQIASDIVNEQTPRRLFQVRGKLYELLVNCIPPDVILKRLLAELMKKLDSELKHEVAHWAAYYEHRLQLGQKPIFHIEAFVAKFMSIYKKFLIANFG